MPDAADDTTQVPNTVAWVLSYFGPEQDQRADSLHLAYSKDGLHWTALAQGFPTYFAPIGTGHIRDPFIFRKRDGSFVYVATDWTQSVNDANYWNHPSASIFVAESPDLIQWTNPHLLRVNDLPGPNNTVMHAWAPEVYWDSARAAYAIVWSGNDATGANHIYASYTSDFVNVTTFTPSVLFDPGYSVIDGTVVRTGTQAFLLFKDETDNSGSPLTGNGKDIQIARAPTNSIVPGSFTRWSPAYITRGADQTTRQATEGPFVIYDPTTARYYLYADYYLRGGVFGCWSTPDLDVDPGSWTKLDPSQYAMPPGVRHANTVRVTQAELDALVARDTAVHHIRSDYSEANLPFYISHSWFHGILAKLAEPTLTTGDNLWRLSPGLSAPSDPALVSLEAVGYPRYFLRWDSSNPSRYPPCGEASTYGWALCNVPATDRHHLTWLDPYTDTAAYRKDATFRVVPALNGVSGQVSFQSVSDPARYLRHVWYQLFAATIDGSTVQKNDASFVVE